METKLKTATDFTVWLAFITTLLATVSLLTFGTVYLIQGEPIGWQLIGASMLTLAMHYALRRL